MDRVPAAVQQCEHTHLLCAVISGLRASITSKLSMKAPLTFLTFPNENDFVAMWLSGWQKHVGLSLQAYSASITDRVSGTVCVHASNPQRLCTCRRCWMFLAALTSSQPASSRKQTTHNYPVQPQHHFLQVADPKGSVSLATLLPGRQFGWAGSMSQRWQRWGRGNSWLVEARLISA